MYIHRNEFSLHNELVQKNEKNGSSQVLGCKKIKILFCMLYGNINL